jgi:hypothetical protein
MNQWRIAAALGTEAPEIAATGEKLNWTVTETLCIGWTETAGDTVASVNVGRVRASPLELVKQANGEVLCGRVGIHSVITVSTVSIFKFPLSGELGTLPDNDRTLPFTNRADGCGIVSVG